MSGQTPFIVTECPHCRSKNMACDVTGVRLFNDDYGNFSGFFTSFCRACKRPLGGAFQSAKRAGNPWERYEREQQEKQRLITPANLGQGTVILGIWPEAPKPKRFDHLPPEVNVAMRDAEDARASGTPNRLVRGAYRTVIDVATQHIFAANLDAFKPGTSPDQKLNNRIDMLTSKHFLTPSLRDWAHSIRFITNEDVHTSSPVSNEEVTEIAEFTDMLLQYLFELPGRVKQAKETAEQKRAAAEAEG